MTKKRKTKKKHAPAWVLCKASPNILMCVEYFVDGEHWATDGLWSNTLISFDLSNCFYPFVRARFKLAVDPRKKK